MGLKLLLRVVGEAESEVFDVKAGGAGYVSFPVNRAVAAVFEETENALQVGELGAVVRLKREMKPAVGNPDAVQIYAFSGKQPPCRKGGRYILRPEEGVDVAVGMGVQDDEPVQMHRVEGLDAYAVELDFGVGRSLQAGDEAFGEGCLHARALDGDKRRPQQHQECRQYP